MKIIISFTKNPLTIHRLVRERIFEETQKKIDLKKCI